MWEELIWTSVDSQVALTMYVYAYTCLQLSSNVGQHSQGLPRRHPVIPVLAAEQNCWSLASVLRPRISFLRRPSKR